MVLILIKAEETQIMFLQETDQEKQNLAAHNLDGFKNIVGEEEEMEKHQ